MSLEYGEKKMGTLPRVIPEGTVDYRMRVLKFTEDLFGCRKLESLNDIMAGSLGIDSGQLIPIIVLERQGHD